VCPAHCPPALPCPLCPRPAEVDGKLLRFFSANNSSKTYYGPFLLRPLSFLRSAHLPPACQPAGGPAVLKPAGACPGCWACPPDSCAGAWLHAGACAACLETRRCSAGQTTSGGGCGRFAPAIKASGSSSGRCPQLLEGRYHDYFIPNNQLPLPPGAGEWAATTAGCRSWKTQTCAPACTWQVRGHWARVLLWM
jgi:hypothetical protein